MKNINIIFNLFVTILLSQSPTNAIDKTTHPAQAEEEVIRHLIRAETWYWMARATSNSLEYHEYAGQAYLRAKDKAAELPQALKATYTNTAEAGSEQTYWRKINAWNSFRNIFPAAWWLSLADSTLDFQDEDHLMLALEGSWAGLEPGILRQLTPKLFVIPRCNDSEIFEQSTDCGEIKDEFLNTLDMNYRFLGVRDDAVAAAIGPDWVNFMKGGIPEPDHIRALGDFLKMNNIIIADIIVIDEFEDPIVAGRIDMEFNHWDIKTMKIINSGNDSGVVVSLRDRRWIFPAWVLFLFVVSLSYVRFRVGTSDFSSYIAPYFIFFISGFILSHFAGRFSSQFIPDWGAMALNTDHYLPLTEMWLWAFFHGAMVMVGPIILCAYFLLKFASKLPLLGEMELDTSSILFTVQSGALGALFGPIILAWQGEGIILAGLLTVSALILSVAVSSPFSTLMGTDSGTVHPAPGMAFMIGTIGLLLIIPIGFFRPEWGGHWPLYISVFISAVIGFSIMRTKAEQETEEKKELISGKDGGSIEYPLWLDNEAIHLEELVKDLSTPGVHALVIGSEQGIGKTRMIEELEKQFILNETPWKIGSALCEYIENDEAREPFQVISSAFSPVLGISSLAARQSNMAKISEALSGIEDQFADLPGVGSLFALGGDEDHQTASKDQIIRDMSEAVRKQSQHYPLAFMLDDMQWADESSIELLDQLILRLSRQDLECPVTFILSGRKQPLISHWFNEENLEQPFPRKIVTLSPFGTKSIDDFLINAGVSEFSSEFGTKVIDYLGSGNPQHVLEFLKGLVATNKAIIRADGTLALEMGLTDDDLMDAVPAELNEQLRMRISQLHEEDIMVLEAAAQIGRTFSTGQLAAGLAEDRLLLLRSMRRIEDEFHLVVDEDKSDDLMMLESDALRNVLRTMAVNKAKNPHKVFKELHYRIANYMIENDERYLPVHIMNHCLQSAERLGSQALAYGLKACNSAAGKFAWSELLLVINKLNNAELLESAVPETRDQLYFHQAKGLRGIGGQAAQQETHDILETLFDSQYLPAFDLFYTYFENEYVLKDPENLEKLILKIQDLQGVNFNNKPLLHALSEFYRISASGILETIDLQQHIEELKSLRKTIDQLEVAEDQKQSQMFLLSIIIQESAIRLANSRGENIHDQVLQLFDESLALKQKTGDLQGIAINLGSRGNYFLFSRKDYTKAEDYLSQDLDHVEKMGAEGDRAGILNRLAICFWEQANETSSTDESEKLKNKACSHAFESFKVSDQLGLTFNVVHAAGNIFRYATETNELALVDTAGKRLNDAELWQGIRNPNLKTQTLDIVNELEKKWEEWDWISPLKALLNPDKKST